uniref:Uncharacterized protein n=1 Tax=Octopus bimaculoides TaxID=37653 RepID=A0A0L8G6X8_OCTBM
MSIILCQLMGGDHHCNLFTICFSMKHYNDSCIACVCMYLHLLHFAHVCWNK